MEQPIIAGSLKSSNENIVKISANKEYPDLVEVEGIGFGTAEITYQHSDGKTYSISVVVELPELGFYTTPTATQAGYITEFTVTDDGQNEIYLVSMGPTLNNVSLNDEFNDFATVTLNDDKTYAMISIDGMPNNRWYGVNAEVTNGNSTWMSGASIQIVNGKSSLQYCYTNWNNDVPAPNGNMQNYLYIAKGYTSNIYTYFTSNGIQQLVA